MACTPAKRSGPARTLALGGVLAVCAFLVSMAADETRAVVNPHNSSTPEYCINCHTEEIYAGNCDEVSGFCLLADSVDALCLVCHVKKECCSEGQRHQSKLYLGRQSHSSDVKTGEVNPAYLPRTLPVHRGTITCRTCHLHTRRSDSDYKMLRIVTKNRNGVDWSLLCADCHPDK